MKNQILMTLPPPQVALGLLLISIGFIAKFQIKIDLSDQNNNL